MPEPRIVIGDRLAVFRRTNGDIHLGLGYIDAHIDLFLFHIYPPSNTGPVL